MEEIFPSYKKLSNIPKQRLKDIYEIFSVLDKDKDGSISAKEIHDFLVTLKLDPSATKPKPKSADTEISPQNNEQEPKINPNLEYVVANEGSSRDSHDAVPRDMVRALSISPSTEETRLANEGAIIGSSSPKTRDARARDEGPRIEDRIMQLIDVDKSGSIDFEEFARIADKELPLNHNIRQSFKKHNKNKKRASPTLTQKQQLRKQSSTTLRTTAQNGDNKNHRRLTHGSQSLSFANDGAYNDTTYNLAEKKEDKKVTFRLLKRASTTNEDMLFGQKRGETLQNCYKQAGQQESQNNQDTLLTTPLLSSKEGGTVCGGDETKETQPILKTNISNLESQPEESNARKENSKAPETEGEDEEQDEDVETDDEGEREYLDLLRHVFSAFDADGDGFIDRDEIKRVLHALGLDITEKGLGAMIAQADKDGNERIDFDEFVRMNRERDRAMAKKASWGAHNHKGAQGGGGGGLFSFRSHFPLLSGTDKEGANHRDQLTSSDSSDDDGDNDGNHLAFLKTNPLVRRAKKFLRRFFAASEPKPNNPRPDDWAHGPPQNLALSSTPHNPGNK